MKKIRENILTIGWALQLALKIDARVFLVWGSLSVVLAVLPAVALHFNRQAVSVLSDFLLTGQGVFQDAVPSILALGAVLTAVGLSRGLMSVQLPS